MKVNFSLLFYFKKNQNHQSGPVPIYLRLTVAGQRAEVSTGRECEPGKWNAGAGRISGTKEATKSLNRYLDSLQSKVATPSCISRSPRMCRLITFTGGSSSD